MLCTSPVSFREMTVSCGKCARCRERKSWLKRQRVGLEVQGHLGERAWFCTLTFGADQEGDAYRSVQLWLKRLRKGLPGKKVRYVAAREYGARNGRLHYHVLVFCDHPVKYRELPVWDHGFYKYKIGDRSAWEYITKYIQKSGGKLRGSVKLGVGTLESVIAHPLALAVLEHFPGTAVKRIGKFKVTKEVASAVADLPISAVPISEAEKWFNNANRHELDQCMSDSSHSGSHPALHNDEIYFIGSRQHQTTSRSTTQTPKPNKQTIWCRWSEGSGGYLPGNRGGTRW